MKRSLAIALFCGLLLVAFYRNAAGQLELVREIAPGVFVRLAEPDKKIIANAGWVVFRDYVLVIDANYPWGARAIVADLRKTTVGFVFQKFNLLPNLTASDNIAIGWHYVPKSRITDLA